MSALNPTLLLTWSAAVAFVYSKGLGEPSPAYAIPFGISAGAGVGGWFVALVSLMRRYGGKLPMAAFTWTVRSLGLVLVLLGVTSALRLLRWMSGHG